MAAAREERDLVIDPPGAAAPAALEVEMPAARLHPADPPTLRADDARQQALRVVPVAVRDVAPQPVHEPGLVAGAGAAEPPHLVVPEVPHVSVVGQPLDCVPAH